MLWIFNHEWNEFFRRLQSPVFPDSLDSFHSWFNMPQNPGDPSESFREVALILESRGRGELDHEWNE